MVTSPSVSAAAEANVTAPPSASRACSASGTALPAQVRRAYDGEPGPAKTQSAARSRAISTACAARCAGGALRNDTASTWRPTLSRKNCCAFSVSSSAFSWKP